MKSMESRSFAVLDSHQRMLDRQETREANYKLEQDQYKVRLARRQRETVDDKVATAVLKLRGCNVPTAISLIQSMSTQDRDIYLLAEETGSNRSSILRAFPAVRKAVRFAFEGTQDKLEETPAEPTEVSAEAQVEGEEPQTEE